MSSYDHDHLFIIALLILFASISSSTSHSLIPPTSPLQLLHDHDHNNATTIQIPIIYTSEGLLVQVHVGEPPQTLYLLPDTGSDVSWVYCVDGANTYGDAPPPPYRAFDHRRSLTFAPVYCTSPSCDGSVATGRRCSAAHEFCDYRHDYEDGTSTKGYWATDTVAVSSGDRDESPVRFHDVMIGCSSREATNLADADGVLGLSPGHPSFTSLMASKFGYVLSYTLAEEGDRHGDDHITFSRAGTIGYQRMQYAGLVDGRSLFHVQVSRFLIDGAALDAPGDMWKLDARDESGGTILDIGTTLTYVPQATFRAIYAAFFGSREADLDGGDVKSGGADTMCFRSWGAPNASEVPELAIEFEGGARFVPRRESLVYEKEEGVWCLGLRPVGEGGDGAIVGRLLQKGYFWEFDLRKRRVGFAPLDSNLPKDIQNPSIIVQ